MDRSGKRLGICNRRITNHARGEDFTKLSFAEEEERLDRDKDVAQTKTALGFAPKAVFV
jgi:hypothetical protein